MSDKLVEYRGDCDSGSKRVQFDSQMPRPSRAHRFFLGSFLSVTFACSLFSACGKPSSSGLYGSGAAFSDAGAQGGSGGSSGASPISSGGNAAQSSAGSAGEAGLQEPADAGAELVDATASVDAAAGSLDASAPEVCVPSEELCDGIDNNCDGNVDEATTCVPECFGFVSQSHTYKYCADGESIGVAQTRCQLDNMRLAWIETPEEGAALTARIGAFPSPPGYPDIDAQRPVRVGATDVDEEGQWAWVAESGQDQGAFVFWEGAEDGETVGGAYSLWAAGQPNNTDADENCGILLIYGGEDGEPGQWNDVSCTEDYYFVCETP